MVTKDKRNTVKGDKSLTKGKRNTVKRDESPKKEEIMRYSDRPKKKLTARERQKSIEEISASIKRTFSKKYLNEWLE